MDLQDVESRVVVLHCLLVLYPLIQLVAIQQNQLMLHHVHIQCFVGLKQLHLYNQIVMS